MITYKGKKFDCIIEQYDNHRGGDNRDKIDVDRKDVKAGIYQHIWRKYLPATGKFKRFTGEPICYKNFDCMEVPSLGVFVVAIFKVKLK